MRFDWKKWALRLGIGLATLLLLLWLAGWILTTVYGDTIKQRALAEANRRLRATLDFDRVELSFFRHFPAPTVSLTELSLIGRDRFAGDTLVAFGRADLAINLFSLFGESIEVSGLFLDRVTVRALVLPDGAANWDVVIPDSAAQADTATASPSAFRLRLSRYAVTDASIRYRDQTFPIDLRLEGVSHRGRGDLTATVIDLRTVNDIRSIVLDYAGTRYLSGQRVAGDVGLTLDLTDPAAMKVTLTDTRVRLNELPLSAQGSITLREADMPLDLTFALGESDLKGLLSLVPALYQNQFDKLEAAGTIALQATVKGVYSETSLPGFNLGLQVSGGDVGYRDLPARITGLGLDLAIDNPSGVIDRTVINLKSLSASVAGQPLSARLRVEGLSHPVLDGALKAALDLAVIPQLYPLPDYTLAGRLEADATFSGTLESTRFPTAKGFVALTDGRITAKQLPVPLEALSARLTVSNSTPDGRDLSLRLDPFSLTLGKQPLSGKVIVSGLADPAYDIALKGTLDLALIDSLFPEEGRTLRGLFSADLATTGRVSDVQKKRYDKLAASGFAALSNLQFVSKASPVPLAIASARADLSPRALQLTQFDARIGRSDLALRGALTDAVPFALGKGTLKGSLTATSTLLYLNEFLADEPTAKAPTDTVAVALEAPILPKDVDLSFDATAATIKYTRLDMRDFKGLVTLKDQVLRIVDCRFAAAGGTFAATAAYDTRNAQKPHSTLAMKIDRLDIAQAVEQLPIIPQLAPLARFTQGLLSTDLSLSTDLKPNLMPDLGTLSMAGAFEAVKAAVKGFPVTQQLAATSKLSFLDNLAIERAAFKARITDGRLHVQPFAFPVAGQTVTVSGSNGLDQSLDYRVGVEVPADQLGAAGAAVQQLMGQLGGNAPTTVVLNFGVGGTATMPTITPLAPSVGSGGGKPTTGGIAGAAVAPVKQQVADTVGKARAEAEAKLKAEQDRLKKEADAAKADAERRAREEQERLKKEAEEKLKKLNPFRKN